MFPLIDYFDRFQIKNQKAFSICPEKSVWSSLLRVGWSDFYTLGPLNPRFSLVIQISKAIQIDSVQDFSANRKRLQEKFPFPPSARWCVGIAHEMAGMVDSFFFIFVSDFARDTRVYTYVTNVLIIYLMLPA